MFLRKSPSLGANEIHPWHVWTFSGHMTCRSNVLAFIRSLSVGYGSVYMELEMDAVMHAGRRPVRRARGLAELSRQRRPAPVGSRRWS